MRTQPETRARSSQEAGKRALNLWGSKANQACNYFFEAAPTSLATTRRPAGAHACIMGIPVPPPWVLFIAKGGGEKINVAKRVAKSENEISLKCPT